MYFKLTWFKSNICDLTWPILFLTGLDLDLDKWFAGNLWIDLLTGLVICNLTWPEKVCTPLVYHTQPRTQGFKEWHCDSELANQSNQLLQVAKIPSFPPHIAPKVDMNEKNQKLLVILTIHSDKTRSWSGHDLALIQSWPGKWAKPVIHDPVLSSYTVPSLYMYMHVPV